VDSGDSNEAIPRSGADNHGPAPRTCQQCQDSQHFSRKCGECRPTSRNKCYNCDSTEHRKRDCPAGPAIGSSSKRMAERLEYTHNIPLAELEDTTTPPAGSIPGAEPIRRTTTTPSLSWAPNPTVEPIPTAVVLPVGKGSLEKKRGDSTTRKKTPRGITSPLADKRPLPRPRQRPGDSCWDNPTDGGENTRSRGRLKTRCRSTSRRATLSNSQEDLRNFIGKLYANKSRRRSKQRCKNCGTTEPHGFQACPAMNAKCPNCGVKGHSGTVCSVVHLREHRR
jgi:hypothetical protein